MSVDSMTISNASLAQSIRNRGGRRENVRDNVFSAVPWPSIAGVGEAAKLDLHNGIIHVLVGSDYVQIGVHAEPVTQAELVALGRAAAKRLRGA